MTGDTAQATDTKRPRDRTAPFRTADRKAEVRLQTDREAGSVEADVQPRGPDRCPSGCTLLAHSHRICLHSIAGPANVSHIAGIKTP